MAGTFRTITVLFAVSPLAAMFYEPFFEALFDILGWGTPPMKAILMRAAQLGSRNLVSVSTYLAALGAGIWVHYIGTIRDRKSLSKPEKFGDLSTHMYRALDKLSRLKGRRQIYSGPPSDQGKWSADAAGMYTALENDLVGLAPY